jgi:hypothetical protein
MSLTRIRIPRIQGRPPHCPGIWVIRSNFWKGKSMINVGLFLFGDKSH